MVYVKTLRSSSLVINKLIVSLYTTTPDNNNKEICFSSLGYDPPPQMSKGEVQQEAEHCNDKKLSAKRVSELSSELYFAIFIKVIKIMTYVDQFSGLLVN